MDTETRLLALGVLPFREVVRTEYNPPADLGTTEFRDYPSGRRISIRHSGPPRFEVGTRIPIDQ